MTDATDPIAAAYDKAIDEVSADIARNPDPRAVRLAFLARMRDQYLAGEGRATALLSGAFPMAAVTIPPAQLSPRKPGRKQSPQRQAAIAKAREYLLDKTSPVRTKKIYEAVASAGIAIGGTDPVNNFGALLSTANGFRSHGREGWTLADR